MESTYTTPKPEKAIDTDIEKQAGHDHQPVPLGAAAGHTGESLPPPKSLGLDGKDSRERTTVVKALGWLDKLLALWIFLAMAIGIILGNFVPGISETLTKGQFVGVSVPIAVGLLVMMYPILCKVQYETLPEVFSHRGIWKQIGFSVLMNWVVAPFLMVRGHTLLLRSTTAPVLGCMLNCLCFIACSWP